MKGIGVTRIAKGVGFKGVWDELGQGGFQGLPVTGHLRLALVFAWGSALQERFNFSFSRVFWLTKFLIWQGEWALILWVWGTLLIFSNFLRQLVRQFVYTMLISHNRASFHLYWKESSVKHQKVSKYYAIDCSYRIVLSLLTSLLPLNWFQSLSF